MKLRQTNVLAKIVTVIANVVRVGSVLVNENANVAAIVNNIFYVNKKVNNQSLGGDQSLTPWKNTILNHR